MKFPENTTGILGEFSNRQIQTEISIKNEEIIRMKFSPTSALHQKEKRGVQRGLKNKNSNENGKNL